MPPTNEWLRQVRRHVARRWTSNELAELQGQQFDKKWCQALADRHERSIRLFERRSDKPDDMELKSWIDATLYTSKEHLEMLKMFQEKIK